jgi:hypothetical protein
VEDLDVTTTKKLTPHCILLEDDTWALLRNLARREAARSGSDVSASGLVREFVHAGLYGEGRRPKKAEPVCLATA